MQRTLDTPISAAVVAPEFSTATLAQQVYDHLRQSILDNAYPPETPLKEEALATRFKVSRVPVREALQRLASDGLVRMIPRQGAVVSSLSPKQFLDAYRVREALETLAIRLAVPLLTPADIDALERQQAEMRDAAEAGDSDRFFVANADFHARFVTCAGNDYLRAIYEPLIDQMRRYRSPSADLRGGLERSIDEHDAILRAVRAGDAAEAVRLLGEHIRVPQRLLEAELQAASLELQASQENGASR